MSRNHYAKTWDCGRGTVRANTGRNQVRIYSFSSRASRDAACLAYRAPNHCPTAAMEPALASDADVQRALVSEFGVEPWQP